MFLVGPSSEDEMIATFLRAELESGRWSGPIADALRGHGADARLFTSAALTSPEENALRRRILDETRGYGRREGLFAGFPDDVRWDRVVLTREELAAVPAPLNGRPRKTLARTTPTGALTECLSAVA